MSFTQLTLLRHGQSVWNRENRFTGWVDVSLSPDGEEEAKAAAAALATAGMSFDAAFSSYLRRAIRTLWLVLEEMDLMWLPQRADWRLNERHYGALQGQNKTEAAAIYGADKVRQWRRGYASPPPPGEPVAAADRRYDGVVLPVGESLQDVLPRVRAVFDERLTPLLTARRRVLLVAHGNSLRALIKHLEALGNDEIMHVEIPTGRPLVYALDKRLRPTDKHFLPAED